MMDTYFRFMCPNPLCGKRLKATPEFIGRKARCGCGQSVVVPVPAAEILSLDEDPAPPPPAPKPVPSRGGSRFVGTPRASTEAGPPRARLVALWPAAAVAVLVATTGGVWLLAKGRDALPTSDPLVETRGGGDAAQVSVVARSRATTEEPVVARTAVVEDLPRPVVETAKAPAPTPAEKPAVKLSAQILGDWKSVTNPGWEVGFSKSGSIVLTTPSYWHVTFYSFTSDDTIRYSGPPSPGSFGGPADEVVKLKLVGDELTMAFERGPTIKFVREKKAR